jgi:hypothetical protein
MINADQIRYGHDTPDECVEHLETFWRGRWRKRFAWWPARVWIINRAGWAREVGWVWLSEVIEVRAGILDEWIVYRDFQYALKARQSTATLHSP